MDSTFSCDRNARNPIGPYIDNSVTNSGEAQRDAYTRRYTAAALTAVLGTAVLFAPNMRVEFQPQRMNVGFVGADLRTDESPSQHLLLKLEQLGELSDDWDSYGAEAPSEGALDIAKSLVKRFASSGLYPDRAVPSVEGGVGLVFLQGSSYLDVEIFNDGETLLGESHLERDSHVYEVSQDDVDEIINRVRGFLGR